MPLILIYLKFCKKRIAFTGKVFNFAHEIVPNPICSEIISDNPPMQKTYVTIGLFNAEYLQMSDIPINTHTHTISATHN